MANKGSLGAQPKARAALSNCEAAATGQGKALAGRRGTKKPSDEVCRVLECLMRKRKPPRCRTRSPTVGNRVGSKTPTLGGSSEPNLAKVKNAKSTSALKGTAHSPSCVAVASSGASRSGGKGAAGAGGTLMVRGRALRASRNCRFEKSWKSWPTISCCSLTEERTFATALGEVYERARNSMKQRRVRRVAGKGVKP